MIRDLVFDWSKQDIIAAKGCPPEIAECELLPWTLVENCEQGGNYPVQFVCQNCHDLKQDSVAQWQEKLSTKSYHIVEMKRYHFSDPDNSRRVSTLIDIYFGRCPGCREAYWAKNA